VLGASGEALGTSTVTYPVDMLEVVHGEIIETADVSSAGMDGWIQRYVISVEGEEIEVQVWCSGTAEALASHDDELRAVVKDRGKSWAIRAAEHAQPGRGAKALVRCDSTGVSTRYEYAHPVRSLFSPIRFVFRDSVTSISASEFDALVEELRGEGDLALRPRVLFSRLVHGVGKSLPGYPSSMPTQLRLRSIGSARRGSCSRGSAASETTCGSNTANPTSALRSDPVRCRQSRRWGTHGAGGTGTWRREHASAGNLTAEIPC
jgi:hypothetical protein